MHIGYFSSIMGKTGGPAINDKYVIEAIARIDHKNKYTVYGINDHALSDVHLNNENFQSKKIFPSGMWLGVACGLTLELKRHPVDLLHATFVAPPIVPGRFIMTIGCWSQYEHPELYPPLVRWRLLYLYNRGIRNANAIFCYTHFLKERLIEKFEFEPEKIFVINPGIDTNMTRVNEQATQEYLEKLGIIDPYILFIGTLNKRKNVHRLVQAYTRMRAENSLEHKLVLLGEQGYFADEILELIRESQFSEDIILAGRRPYAELPYFYSGADLFVFPTISEGFGLPPLEAMACGAPVAASNVTSVPEVVGDAAALFDPFSVEEIAGTMYKCLTDRQYRDALKIKGDERAKGFSWERASLETVAAYETVYHSKW